MHEHPTIKITFRFSLDDFRAYGKMQRRLSPVRRYLDYILLAIDLGFIVAGILTDQKILWLFGLAHGIAWSLWLTLGRPWKLKRHFTQQRLGEQDSHMSASKNGLAYDTTKADANFTWDTFRAFDEGSEHFVLWLNRFQGICIPKRAFANDNDLVAFRGLARAKISGKTAT